MKRFLFLIVLLLGAMNAARSQGEVYNRYASREGYIVSEVKGYKVSDTVSLDVTMVTVEDSVGWEAFLREINVHELQIEKMRESKKNGRKALIHFNCERDHPEIHPVPRAEGLGFVLIDNVHNTMYYFDLKKYEYGAIFSRTQFKTLFQKTNDYINSKKQ